MQHDQPLVLVAARRSARRPGSGAPAAPASPQRVAARATPPAQRTTTISAISSTEARYMNARWVRWMSTRRDLPERHEVAVAGGELACRRRGGRRRRAGSPARPYFCVPGHVAAGHDRAEHRHARGDRQHARAAAARPRRVAPATAAPEVEQPAEQEHRQAEVGGHEASSRFSSTVAPPSPAWARISTSRPTAVARGTARWRRHASTTSATIMMLTIPASARCVYSTIVVEVDARAPRRRCRTASRGSRSRPGRSRARSRTRARCRPR